MVILRLVSVLGKWLRKHHVRTLILALLLFTSFIAQVRGLGVPPDDWANAILFALISLAIGELVIGRRA